jgi:hypothetical protein
MAGRLTPGGEPQCGGAPGVVPDAGTAVHGRDVAKRGRCAADAAAWFVEEDTGVEVSSAVNKGGAPRRATTVPGV